MATDTFFKSLLHLVLAVSLLLWVGPGAGDLYAETESTEPRGELHLTGRFIERLVLLRFGHGEMVLESPASTVLLPEGKYAWSQVTLRGKRTGAKFTAYSHSGSWLQIAAGKPATLDVGGPLEPLVHVQRRGDRLVLSHHLRGTGGEYYHSSSRRTRPEFAVTHDGQAVGSGRFEYG